jgi:HipA-like protein
MNNHDDRDNPGLDVYLRDQKVGRLWLDEKRRFVFQYDAEWIRQQGAVPLSLHLPLRAESYPDDLSRPFFSNLLPEADIKRVIAQRLQISESNDFAMLNRIGGECAGAVSLLPSGVTPAVKPGYQELNEEDHNRPSPKTADGRRGGDAPFPGRGAEQAAGLQGRRPHLHRLGKCAEQPHPEAADQGSGGYGRQ